jgi:hypothetical protein
MTLQPVARARSARSADLTDTHPARPIRRHPSRPTSGPNYDAIIAELLDPSLQLLTTPALQSALARSVPARPRPVPSRPRSAPSPALAVRGPSPLGSTPLIRLFSNSESGLTHLYSQRGGHRGQCGASSVPQREPHPVGCVLAKGWHDMGW